MAYAWILPQRRACWSLPVVTPALFALCLVVAAPRPGVWLDEAATVSATSRSWSDLWLLTEHQDRSLLGYYATTKVVADLVGCDPLTAGRALSASCYVLATIVTSLIALKFWGRAASFAAGASLVILPAAAAGAVNARPESVSAFLVAAYFYSAMRRWRCMQAACAILACLMYALNVLYLPLALVIQIILRRRPSRADITISAILSAMGAGWLLACASQQKQVGWINTTPGADVMASFLRVGVSAPTSRTNEALVTGVSVALGVLVTSIALSLVACPSTRKCAAMLLAMWVFPPLVVCGAVLAGKDIFVARYFTPSVIGMSLLLGYAFSRMRGSPLSRYFTVVVMVGACIPSFLSSHAPDGHWGEDLGVHRSEIRAAGPQQVAFVAPRNRAALFADGHLEPEWREASWWRQAQERGQLWGPSTPVPSGTRLVVVDTRSLKRLSGLHGCAFARSEVLHQEARFTSVGVECAH